MTPNILDWLRIQHYAEDGAQPEYRRGWNDAIGHVERFVSGADASGRLGGTREIRPADAAVATAPAVAARDTATIFDDPPCDCWDVPSRHTEDDGHRASCSLHRDAPDDTAAPHGQAQDWEMP